MSKTKKRKEDCVDWDHLRKLRNGGGSGIIVTLYLDLTSDQIVSAGEPGDMVLALSPAFSLTVLSWLMRHQLDGDAVELVDQAAFSIGSLLMAGVDRQALVGPMLAALQDSGIHGNNRDPLAGYMGRQFMADRLSEEESIALGHLPDEAGRFAKPSDTEQRKIQQNFADRWAKLGWGDDVA